jgi:hypothetical protein
MEDDDIQSNGDPTVDILIDLINGRNQLFQRTLNMVPHQNRTLVLNNMLINEYAYINLLNRLHTSYIRDSTVTAYITVGDNTTTPGFSDPVPVVPTNAQITNAVTYETANSQSNNCAICQESIDGELVRIRHCGHIYHRTCLSTWFQTSVRCPVCRHDIRATDPVTQTSSDAE